MSPRIFSNSDVFLFVFSVLKVVFCFECTSGEQRFVNVFCYLNNVWCTGGILQ